MTPGECLFLSLAGFHNERGTLEMPPYPPSISTHLFGYDLESYDVSKNTDINHNEGKVSNAVVVRDSWQRCFSRPWGNEYVYEYPREDDNPGYRLFSKGTDGETGEVQWEEDDIE